MCVTRVQLFFMVAGFIAGLVSLSGVIYHLIMTFEWNDIVAWGGMLSFILFEVSDLFKPEFEDNDMEDK